MVEQSIIPSLVVNSHPSIFPSRMPGRLHSTESCRFESDLRADGVVQLDRTSVIVSHPSCRDLSSFPPGECRWNYIIARDRCRFESGSCFGRVAQWVEPEVSPIPCRLPFLMSAHRYPCPCCGYRTYAFPSVATGELCLVCFWEDARVWWQCDNRVPLLAAAQREYLATGASQAIYLDIVRPPLAEEARSVHWLSVDELREKVIALIEEAFEGVSLEDGTTLHQREVVDAFGSEEEFLKARKLDPETDWKWIPDEKILRMGMGLIFLDPQGVRFHLPAFMRCALRVWEPDCWNPYELMVYALKTAFQPDDYFTGTFEILDQSQREAVAAFLSFIRHYDPHFENEAQDALDRAWGTYVPDFVNLIYR
jgi:hypothetical protein